MITLHATLYKFENSLWIITFDPVKFTVFKEYLKVKVQVFSIIFIIFP